MNAIFGDHGDTVGHRCLRVRDLDLLAIDADFTAGQWIDAAQDTGKRTPAAAKQTGNANHLANDFLYAWSKTAGQGLRVSALSANPAVLTCLANDEGYDQVYSLQLAVQAQPGDILIAFSGSGNSPNIVKALEEGKRIGMRSYAVLGFTGGKAKPLADVPIHFETDDMQIAEDTQVVIGHAIVQYLNARRSEVSK